MSTDEKPISAQSPALWPTAHQAILAGQSPAIPGPAAPPQAESDEYREQAEAIIADLRARVSHYEALVVAVREETLERAAKAIEARRSEHWQRHLREHPYADGTSCPGDYAAHDAYYDAAKIVRALSTPPGNTRGDA